MLYTFLYLILGLVIGVVGCTDAQNNDDEEALRVIRILGLPGTLVIVMIAWPALVALAAWRWLTRR